MGEFSKLISEKSNEELREIVKSISNYHVEACERRREKNRVKELQEKKNNAYFRYKLSLNNIKTNNEFES